MDYALQFWNVLLFSLLAKKVVYYLPDISCASRTALTIKQIDCMAGAPVFCASIPSLWSLKALVHYDYSLHIIQWTYFTLSFSLLLRILSWFWVLLNLTILFLDRMEGPRSGFLWSACWNTNMTLFVLCLSSVEKKALC